MSGGAGGRMASAGVWTGRGGVLKDRRPPCLRRTAAHDRHHYLFLSLLRRDDRLGGDGDRRAQSRALGAVPDPRLRQRRRAVRAPQCRVPGDDPDRRLCRRGRGALPVRGDDARRRLRRAPPGLPQLPAGRRADRHRAPRRAAHRPRRLGFRAGRHGRAAGAGPRRVQHRGARPDPLHALRLLLPGGGHGAARRHGRRDRAHAPPSRNVKRQSVAAQVGRTPATAIEVRKVETGKGI